MNTRAVIVEDGSVLDLILIVTPRGRHLDDLRRRYARYKPVKKDIVAKR